MSFTLAAVLAEVSKKKRPFSSAYTRASCNINGFMEEGITKNKAHYIEEETKQVAMFNIQYSNFVAKTEVLESRSIKRYNYRTI